MSRLKARVNSGINTFLMVFVMIPLLAFAHAEHDKERYVASDGEDVGRCDQKNTPCKTIAYTAHQAGKGDRVLVAEGRYEVTDADSIFYLASTAVPISGGYSRDNYSRDSYKPSASRENTLLVGVPAEFAASLAEKGFSVISDTKGFSREQKVTLQAKKIQYQAMNTSQAESVCVDGKAGAFECSRMNLLAHVTLPTLGDATSQGNDIWGHYDLNDGREYALVGLTNGVSIVDVTQPTQPRVVSFISSTRTIWRDLAVYQYFDKSRQRWMAYAYVSADAASVGTMILDLNQLPTKVTHVATENSDTSGHNIYISNVDYSTGVALTNREAFLHVAGSNKMGGAFNSYSLQNPLSPLAVYKNSANSRANYSHDVSSLLIDDQRREQCSDKLANCEVMIDYNENEILLWDKTLNSTPQKLSSTVYEFLSYTHSGWWTEDKKYISVHDELDEQRFGINTRVRFFAIDDLRKPVLAGEYTGPTQAIDHNGYVRGNRYYVSNYERGLLALDITDPTKPIEAGFFDTYPLSNSAAFNGAWGTYPFLPSGNILVNDINSGLYVVADKTQNIQGGLKFSASKITVNEGETLQLQVERIGGSMGVVEVYFETQAADAEVDKDYTAVSGKISWVDGDASSKTISIPIAADTDTNEFAETFFVRLFNPRNGVVLSSPSMAQISVRGKTSTGTAQFDASKLTVIEGQGSVSIPIRRAFGEGELQVEALLNTQGQDVSGYITLEPKSVLWVPGDAENKPITLTVSKNNVTEADRRFILTLSNKSLAGAPEEKLEILVKDTAEVPVIDVVGRSKKSGGGALNIADFLFLWMSAIYLLARRYFLKTTGETYYATVTHN
jgi:choice-of-anchor B domain-containing protein